MSRLCSDQGRRARLRASLRLAVMVFGIYGIIEREYRDAPGNAVEQTRAQMDYLKQLLNS